MRILLVGAGGVGTAFARIAARRRFADLVIADYDLSRAQRAAGRTRTVTGGSAGRPGRGGGRCAADRASLRRADERHRPAVRHAAVTAPRSQAGTHYLDMAMSLSHPTPDAPYGETGIKLGDEQFAMAAEWEQAGSWPWWAWAWSRACPTCSPGYAADTLFREIDEIGVRDGANLRVDGYEFAPTFSIWTTIEECLNPPVDLGGGPGLVHHPAVQRARGVHVPGWDRPGRVRQRGARGGAADARAGSRPAG